MLLVIKNSKKTVPKTFSPVKGRKSSYWELDLFVFLNASHFPALVGELGHFKSSRSVFKTAVLVCAATNPFDTVAHIFSLYTCFSFVSNASLGQASNFFLIVAIFCDYPCYVAYLTVFYCHREMVGSVQRLKYTVSL